MTMLIFTYSLLMILSFFFAMLIGLSNRCIKREICD